MASHWSLVLACLGAAMLLAAPVSAETLPLSGGDDLTISFDAPSQVATVSLGGMSISVGNALEPPSPQPFTSCAGCPQVYLVTIPDASSTYGALTGIVVWPRGLVPWWTLSTLPF